MISVSDALEISTNRLIEQIDSLIKHSANCGYLSFQSPNGNWNKEVLEKVLAEYEECGWRIERVGGFINFSWSK